MDFNTAYNRVRQAGEVNSGEELVERGSYIPAEVQIKRIMDAGIRLEEFKKSLNYDIEGEDGIMDLQVDPTRKGDFDLADASMLSDVGERAINRIKEKGIKLAEEKKDSENGRSVAGDSSSTNSSK